MIQKNGISIIYALQHNSTKNIYIGKTENLYQRYMFHLQNLKEQKHPSKNLQEDFNKYGEDFSIYILEEIEEPRERILFYGELLAKDRIAEVKWMQYYDTLQNGYNTQDKASKRIAYRPKLEIPLEEGYPERSNDDRKCSDS